MHAIVRRLCSEGAAGTLLKNQPPPAFLYHAGSQFLVASPSVTILVTEWEQACRQAFWRQPDGFSLPMWFWGCALVHRASMKDFLGGSGEAVLLYCCLFQLPRSYVKALIPSALVFGGRAFEGWLGQCRRGRKWRFDPWVGNVSWSRKWQSTPVLLFAESHGQRSLVGYSPQGHKETDTIERQQQQSQ